MSNDMAHLLDEQGIAGELEGLLPVRLQAEGAPDARAGRLRYVHLARDGARASSMLRGAPGTRRIEQSVQALFYEASTALRHRLLRDPLARSDHLVVMN